MAPLILDRLLLRGTTHDMMIEARIALETAAIGLAVEHADARDLDKILENVEDSKEVLGAEYARDGVGRMIKFHVLVAEASHNIPYIIFIESMMEWAVIRLEKWIPSPEEQEFSYMSHKKMVESIKNQDKSLAVDLMRKHIQEVGTLLVSRGSVSLT